MYAGDALSDTQHLTAQEFGAYMRLLLTAWRGTSGLPQCWIPDDDGKLARITGMSAVQWGRAKGEVLALFTRDADRKAYFHRRLQRQQKRADSARDSASHRWNGHTKKGGEVKQVMEGIEQPKPPAEPPPGNLRAEIGDAKKVLRGLKMPGDLKREADSDLRGATSIAEVQAIVAGARQAAARNDLEGAKPA
jgi:uncharacterized protein YdaU (DUF1376 family)